MSFFEVLLLIIPVFLEVVFFGVAAFVHFTKPVTKRDGLRYITENAAYQRWSKRRDLLVKIIQPLILHIIAGSCLILWVIIRVVISFQ